MLGLIATRSIRILRPSAHYALVPVGLMLLVLFDQHARSRTL